MGQQVEGRGASLGRCGGDEGAWRRSGEKEGGGHWSGRQETGRGGESPSPVEASRHEGLKVDGAGERWKEGQAQTEKERGGEYGTDVASWRERQARNEQGGHHHERPLRRAPPIGAVAQEALLGPGVAPQPWAWRGLWGLVGAEAVLLSNSYRDILGRPVGHHMADPTCTG